MSQFFSQVVKNYLSSEVKHAHAAEGTRSTEEAMHSMIQEESCLDTSSRTKISSDKPKHQHPWIFSLGRSSPDLSICKAFQYPYEVRATVRNYPPLHERGSPALLLNAGSRGSANLL